jgi:alkylated DNA repair dioxygenase AlkB
MAASGGLFGVDVPDGFRYASDFITEDEERTLAAAIASVTFSPFEMRGVTARRRVAFFGASYVAGTTSPPIPEFLLDVRARLAVWAGIEPAAFAMSLINEYPPGAPIGWHRDAPQYELVAGLSMLAPCRIKFRRYERPGQVQGGRRVATHEIALEPRSAYLIAGPARNGFEHHIPAVTRLRYSITFRTLRGGPPTVGPA